MAGKKACPPYKKTALGKTNGGFLLPTVYSLLRYNFTNQNVLSARELTMITSPFSLPLSERIKLVEALWDSIAHEQAALSIPLEHQKELDLRLRAYSKDRLKGRLSHDVLADIWKKL